jgi:hypothetical protein
MYALIAAGLLASAAPAEPPGGAAGQLKTAKETYAQAQQVYDSCETRAYAAYDDICDQLGKQLHDYAVEIDKLTRKAEDEKLRSGSRP